MLYQINETYTPHDSDCDRSRQSFRFEAEDLFDDNGDAKSHEVLYAVIREGLKAAGLGDSVDCFMKDIQNDEEPAQLLEYAADDDTFTVMGGGNNGDYEWEFILDPEDKPDGLTFDQGKYINKLADSLRGDNHLYTALVSIKSPPDFGRASAILRKALNPDQFRIVSAVFQIVANIGGEHDAYPPSAQPKPEATKTDG